MHRENFLERQKMGSILLYVFLLALAVFLPLTSAHATSIGTNVSVTGTLTVTDTSEFTAAATFNGNVTVGNLATADTLTVTARLASNLNPSANDTYDLGAFALAYNDVFASGTARLAGFTSAVNGVVTVGTSTANTLTITARLAADLDPSTNNERDLGTFGLAYKDVFVSGTLYAGTLSQWDTALSLGGNFTAGDATTTDKVYLNSRIASSIIPTANDSEDVGEFSRAWNDVFASGTARLAGFTSAVNGVVTVGTSTANTLTITARLAADLDPNANDTIDLGDFGLAYNDVFVSGTARLAGLTSAVNGSVTIGTSTANTLTVTARLAADLDPSTDNQRDLGTFGLAYKDIYASSTVFAADISDLLYVNAANSRIGISSSTPSAKLSIGTANATSTLDVPQLCFRTTSDAGGSDSEVYYWPCVGSACPNVLAAASGWATSTVSCF